MRTFSERLVFILAWAACAVALAPAADLTQTFRGRSFDPEKFRGTGAKARRVTRPDALGLRITLPADHGNSIPVGFIARSRVRGDFEITLAYEIIRVDKPTAGHAAGVGVYITMDSPTKEAAGIGRQVRSGGEQVFMSHRATTPPGEKRHHSGGPKVPAASTVGQLRLARRGSLLSYLVAEGSGRSFQEIYQTELGTADLDQVRFAADNGGSPTLVDVRITAVSIRTNEPDPDTLAAGAPSRRPRWLAAGLTLTLLALAGGGLGFWAWSRRDRRPSAEGAS